MNPLVLTTAAVSLKKHYILIGGMLLFLIFMPIAAVFAIDSPSTLYNDPTGLYTGPGDPNDHYDWGNCTYWAALLRIQMGDPIPNTWGNANTWAKNAKADGYLVDKTPTYGSIMQTDAGDLGHVAFVENVDPITGKWTISEMNVLGLDMIDTRTLNATDAKNFNFIHDKVDK
jgi:surface antigen